MIGTELKRGSEQGTPMVIPPTPGVLERLSRKLVEKVNPEVNLTAPTFIQKIREGVTVAGLAFGTFPGILFLSFGLPKVGLPLAGAGLLVAAAANHPVKNLRRLGHSIAENVTGLFRYS